jgi:hypothetical protein
MQYQPIKNIYSVYRSSFIVISLVLALISPSQSASRSEAKDIVAIQLRAQGIPCTEPHNAAHDIHDSTPDEMAWIISCREATYRVKLIPHVGARVEIIDNEQSGAIPINPND